MVTAIVNAGSQQPPGPEAHGGPLRVERVSDLETLAGLRAEWDALVSVARGAGLFQSWDWVTAWYQHFGAGVALDVLVVRDADGRLVGLAPCSRSSPMLGLRLLHLLGRGAAAGGEPVAGPAVGARPCGVPRVPRQSCAEWVVAAPAQPGDRAAAAGHRAG